MSREYPRELRQRVIDEYQAGGISMRNLAKKLGVSKTYVYKILRDVKRERLRREAEERKANRPIYAVGGKYDPSSNN